MSIAVHTNLARVNPNPAVRETANLIELMRDEDDRASCAGDIAHLAEAFFLEIYVPDGQDFIDEENLRLEVSSDSEGQADVHAGGVVLYGSVNEFFEFGEGYDFIELALDFALAHAEDGAGEKRVFVAGQLGMKAGADFEKRADAAVNLRPTSGGAGDAREYFQKSGLASAVAADEAEYFAFADFERHILQGPEGLFLLSAQRSDRGS